MPGLCSYTWGAATSLPGLPLEQAGISPVSTHQKYRSTLGSPHTLGHLFFFCSPDNCQLSSCAHLLGLLRWTILHFVLKVLRGDME